MLGDERALRIASAILAGLGIAVATYIAIAEAGGGAPACVAGGGGCEKVANSAYSELAGINVAVIGIGGYVLLLGAALATGDAARFTGLVLALVGFGFSGYLTYLEFFTINATCQWCVVSATIMTALLAVNALRAIRFTGAELSTTKRED